MEKYPKKIDFYGYGNKKTTNKMNKCTKGTCNRCYFGIRLGSTDKHYKNNQTFCARCKTELYCCDFGGPCFEHGCNKSYYWECWRDYLHPEICDYCGITTCCKKNIKLVKYGKHGHSGEDAYACQACIKKLKI